MARRLKLRNIPEFSMLSGGQAIENAASKASNVDEFLFVPVMTKYHNCNFSFAGLLSTGIHYIKIEESKHNIVADMVIPSVYNLCAGFQLAVTTHICHRIQRAMEFIDNMSLIPEDKKTLVRSKIFKKLLHFKRFIQYYFTKQVVSGGVACNNFLAKALNIVSTELGYNFVRTPPKLCTDNGVMIDRVEWDGKMDCGYRGH